MFEDYLLTHHKEELTKILTSTSEEYKHLALNINFIKLFENDPNIGTMIFKDPDKVLDSLDEALINVQRVLTADLNSAEILEKFVHARIYGLPSCHDQHRTSIPRSVDLNLFLQITGSVVRTTLAKLLEFRRHYLCTKCKHKMTVNGVYEQKYVIFAPKKCLNPDGCSGTNIVAVSNIDVNNCKDYQEIKIQEEVSTSSYGHVPNSMWITLEDDLVDTCKPGDDVTICGIVKRRFGPLYPNRKIDVELVLKANHLNVNNAHCSAVLVTPDMKNFFNLFWRKYNNEPLLGRDLILKSICPQLFGLHTVKLAVALVLASGSSTADGDQGAATGTAGRSESHLLMVGDPGTGKSQMLKFAAKIMPRSVLTTGIGSTSAGLTVTAIQENGEWQLEGGALVLADGSICCIDEFNSMKQHDRTSIHEAMEQQTISVAKASIVCKLSTRCSILAAINPKGHFDPNQPLTVNTALPSPLLSRFDIILLLQDTIDLKWDEIVCDHILNHVKICGQYDNSIWGVDLLRAYFSYIRGCHPKLTPETNKILSTYYQAQRAGFMKNRVTVRLLDSLARLSQAHAKLMFHNEVQVMDAVAAVTMIESSMQGSILNLNVNNLHSPFPEDPMHHYSQLISSVLEKLDLQDILEKENDYLTKLAEQRAPNDESTILIDEKRSFNNLNENFKKNKEEENEEDLNKFFGKSKSKTHEENDKNRKVTLRKDKIIFEDSDSDDNNEEMIKLSNIKKSDNNEEKNPKKLLEESISDENCRKETKTTIFGAKKVPSPGKSNQNLMETLETATSNQENKTKKKIFKFRKEIKSPTKNEDPTKEIVHDVTRIEPKISPVTSTKDFLSKFKFSKTEPKKDNNLVTNSTSKNKSNVEEMKSEFDNFKDSTTKIKRKITPGKENKRKKKKVVKSFVNFSDDSDVSIDIENDIDWNLSNSFDNEEITEVPGNREKSSMNFEKNNTKTTSSLRGLFETEEDDNYDLEFNFKR